MKKFILGTLIIMSSFAANAKILIDSVKREKNGATSAVVVYMRCSALPNNAFTVSSKVEQVGFSSQVNTVEVVENKKVGPFVDCMGPSVERFSKINLGNLAAGTYLNNPIKLK